MLSLLLALAVAAPPEVRVVVAAAPAEVWRAWTTPEGLATFLARSPALHAAARDEKRRTITFTSSTVSLAKARGGTEVTITGGGPEAEPALARLRHRFAVGPIDWAYPWRPVAQQDLAWLVGAWRKAEGADVYDEVWTASPAGLAGMSREAKGAASVFHEIFTLSPEDGEWRLRLLMAGERLVPIPGGVRELALHGLDGTAALFHGVGAERDTRLVYRRDGATLRVRLIKKGVEVASFDFTRAAL